MKPNSIHKFEDFAGAFAFIEVINKAGFKCIAEGKDGGSFYSNGRHTLFLCYGKLRSIATQ